MDAASQVYGLAMGHPPAPRTAALADRLPRADDRRTLEAILFVLNTGCRWRDLPRAYDSPVTAWRRLRRWQAEGVWERIWSADHKNSPLRRNQYGFFANRLW